MRKYFWVILVIPIVSIFLDKFEKVNHWYAIGFPIKWIYYLGFNSPPSIYKIFTHYKLFVQTSVRVDLYILNVLVIYLCFILFRKLYKIFYSAIKS